MGNFSGQRARETEQKNKEKLTKAVENIDCYSGCPQFEKEIGCPIMAEIRKAINPPLPCTGKDTGKPASGVGPTEAPASACGVGAASSSKGPASGVGKADESTPGTVAGSSSAAKDSTGEDDETGQMKRKSENNGDGDPSVKKRPAAKAATGGGATSDGVEPSA